MAVADSLDAMHVQVRLFAMLRERAGSSRIELELPDGATVGDALAKLAAGGPLGGLIELLPVRMAVNRDYASADTVLGPDDELALIPPVSGGAPHAATRLREGPLAIEELARAVGRRRGWCDRGLLRCDARGSEPRLRGLQRDGRGAWARIAQECAERHGLAAIAIDHRVGSVPLGEPSVIVAVSAAHREEAFAGAREAIDRVKEQAAIWKRAIERDGTAQWVDGVAPR